MCDLMMILRYDGQVDMVILKLLNTLLTKELMYKLMIIMHQLEKLLQ